MRYENYVIFFLNVQNKTIETVQNFWKIYAKILSATNINVSVNIISHTHRYLLLSLDGKILTKYCAEMKMLLKANLLLYYYLF